MSMTIQSSVKDKILATSSARRIVATRSAEMPPPIVTWTNKWKRGQMMVSTLWIKLYSEYEYEIRYHPGKANVVTNALSRKERVKPRRVRAMAMTIQYGVRGMILAAQREVFKQENVCAERLHGLRRMIYLVVLANTAKSVRDTIGFEYLLSYPHADGQSERMIQDFGRYNGEGIKEWNSGDDQLRFRWMIYLVVLVDAAESVSDTIRFEYCLASSSGWPKSPVIWAEIGGSSLIGPELVHETTDKEVLINEKLKAARDHQKSYADNRRKLLEFEVGDRVLLKVSPWKGVICFGKRFLFDELRDRVVNDVVTQLKVFDEFPR
ncbi:hypothetical protein Tco_0585060 [Tanacetum coccineum]